MAALGLQLGSATAHGTGRMLHALLPTFLVQGAHEISHTITQAGTDVAHRIEPAAILGLLMALPGAFMTTMMGSLGLASAAVPSHQHHAHRMHLPGMHGAHGGVHGEGRRGGWLPGWLVGGGLVGALASWVRPELEDARIR